MPHEKKWSLTTLLDRVERSHQTALPAVVSAITAGGYSTATSTSSYSAITSLKETATVAASMSQESSYFLVPASGGLCIQPQNNGIYTTNVEGKEGQQWIIEKGEGDKIAFRNASGRQYLRAKGGNNSAQVVLGQRQWWTLAGSKTPGAFWIKNEEFPKAYLCNSYGRITPNNLIYMWAPEPYWTQTMLWYIRDVEEWKSLNGSSPGLALLSEGNNAAAAEKQKAREAELQQWQDRNEARQASQDSKEQTLDAQKQQQMKEQQELDTKMKALQSKQKELEQREKDVAAREEQLKQSESRARKDIGDTQYGDAKITDLQRRLSEAREALAGSQTRERQANERAQKVTQAYERPPQNDSAEAAITNEEPHGTRIDESVVAHRLQPLFERASDDTSGALRDDSISAHGLQPLFERTRPKPTIALRYGDTSAHRLQPFFERPSCGNCRMSHVHGEP